MTVAFYTLGCKVNQYETQGIMESFLKKGYSVGDYDEPCDVYVINTCTVTATGDLKSRKAARRAKELNPGAVVIATGCYSQVRPDEVSKIEEIDIITGTKDRLLIVDRLEDFLKSREKITSVGDISAEADIEDIEISGYLGHTRVNIKIEDGCDNFCAYCIIPYARGRVRSKGEAAVLKEINALLDEGFFEMVLTGININSYGKDIGSSLLSLLKKIGEISRPMRFRLGSLEPPLLTEEFLSALSTMPSFCPHFHISLQSGCDKTLARMNRHYKKADFLKSAQLIRKYFKDAAITADVIVGFPGETDEDFKESCDTVAYAKMKHVHVFPYSRRNGTAAASFKDEVPSTVKKARCKALIAISQESALQFHKPFEGKEAEVLFESSLVGENLYEGTTANYITVRVHSDRDITKKLLPVLLTKAHADHMDAKLV